MKYISILGNDIKQFKFEIMKKLKRISIALTLIFNSNLLLAQVYFNLSNVGMAPLQNTGIGVNNITDLNSRFCTSIGNGNIINYSNTAIAIGAAWIWIRSGHTGLGRRHDDKDCHGSE